MLAIAFFGCKKTAQETRQDAPSSKAVPGAATVEVREDKHQALSAVVVQILKTAHRGGGVILQGECNARGIDERYPAVQPVSLEPMEQALREVTAQHQSIYWRESRTSGVRVVDSKAKAGLLKIRIREFRVVEGLEPDAVMTVLWRQPEVTSFLRRSQISFAQRTHGSRKVLSPPMILETKNRTVAEILDRIAGAYHQDPPKVWIYQECRDKRATVIDVRMP